MKEKKIEAINQHFHSSADLITYHLQTNSVTFNILGQSAVITLANLTVSGFEAKISQVFTKGPYLGLGVFLIRDKKCMKSPFTENWEPVKWELNKMTFHVSGPNFRGTYIKMVPAFCPTGNGISGKRDNCGETNPSGVNPIMWNR